MPRFLPTASLYRRTLPNMWDLIAIVIAFSLITAIARSSYGVPNTIGPETHTLVLDYTALPYYALRSTLRMFIALFFAFVFTFTYATLAAKSRRCEMILVPLLDVLQSVPILGFLSFTVTFFIGLFPGSSWGAESAAIFVIFTSQAWNMAFSFYQSLRTVPRELEEVARSFRLSAWQRFWQLETPYAMPGLIHNAMISMSGGWFFVVASEAITVGDTKIQLPGIGSYLAQAIDARNVYAVMAAVIAMLAVILIYDQLLFRPIVAWGSKFRMELTASSEQEHSWVLYLFERTHWFRFLRLGLASVFKWLSRWRLPSIRLPISPMPTLSLPMPPSRLIDGLWIIAILIAFLWASYVAYIFIATELSWLDVWEAFELTGVTLLRVVAMMLLATIVWVPLGIWIGLRPRLAEKIQPLAQFLAAFPANVLFPIFVITILHYNLTPDIWLSLLIIFGTQWYIVFNVIAGASAFPNDLREVVSNFQIRGLEWWRKVMLPAIYPFYITGALTAWGGSWNASIVAEYVKWGNHKIAAHGIGAYIAQATEAGDYPKIVLGIIMMSLFVIIFNRTVWRPLYAYGERRLRID